MTNPVLEVIKKRRSIREYREEQVKEDELESILEGGLWAPSGANKQSWHFTVIQNKQLLAEINNKAKEVLRKGNNDHAKNLGNSEQHNIFFKAPTVIIVSADENSITPKEDTAAAIQNIMLVAESLSIGTCWIETVTDLFSDPELGCEYKEKCEIPKGYDVLSAVCVGYKKCAEKKEPTRKERKINYIK